ncbi:hypothetical protein E4U40_004321 [Claviceps sp. LM458 group G5]|nr:hypothetical protein E4U40_004321 [Claviceps sp. LM458 group G5]
MGRKKRAVAAAFSEKQFVGDQESTIARWDWSDADVQRRDEAGSKMQDAGRRTQEAVSTKHRENVTLSPQSEAV